MLNIGKLKKLIFIKSLTYPKRILSSKLQKIPADNNDAKNTAINFNREIFLITYTKIPKIAAAENTIKKLLQFCKMLNAAPSF